jgi:hypothetical protein
VNTEFGVANSKIGVKNTEFEVRNFAIGVFNTKDGV